MIQWPGGHEESQGAAAMIYECKRMNHRPDSLEGMKILVEQLDTLAGVSA